MGPRRSDGDQFPRRRHRPETPERSHGSHTLRVVEGEIVGAHKDDVFVDLGPRMQGVLSRREFDEPPRIGEIHEFTLRGQEGELWALSLAPRASESRASWEDMEPGTQVQARVIGAQPDGLEVKIGPLHGFMPRSHTGLERGDDLRQLLGKAFACEVLEVDAEKERVLVSRKLVLQRERESERQRLVGALEPGKIISGRVSRIEPYGAFVKFGRGLEGLVHVSDIAHERVAHPGDVLAQGQTVEARVLSIKRGGKRIALGLKQMEESPWARLESVCHEDQIVEGTVTRVAPFGAFVAIRRGVEGLLHRSEARLGPEQGPRGIFRPGQRLVLRICSLDVGAERLSLSLSHRNGSPIDPEEAGASEVEEQSTPTGPRTGPDLGRLLGEALGRLRE